MSSHETGFTRQRANQPKIKLRGKVPLAGLLPRPMAYAGLLIALIAELSTIVLLIPDAAILLPLGRFPGLIWLIAAGFLLPRHRRRHDPAVSN